MQVEHSSEKSKQDLSARLLAPKTAGEEILIPSLPTFQLKLELFRQGGIQNLQILSDFDNTISRTHMNGLSVGCTYAILLDGALNELGKRRARDLSDFYCPIEHDPNIPPDIRAHLMEEWSKSGNDLVIEQGLHKDLLPSLVYNSSLYIRHDVDSLLHLCEKYGVPFTVVSGGIGNIIEVALRSMSAYEGLEVYANFMLWDETGRLKDFSKPSLKSHNKGIALRGKPLCSHLLLIGDSVPDADIVAECSYEHILKIGFVKDPKALPEMEKAYDVLLLNDGNFTFPLNLMKAIIGEEVDISILNLTR